ncbi:MAG: c-type cytochrome, partial [Gammaproteobacteria bacterium]
MIRKILLLSTMAAVTLGVAALVLQVVAPAGASEARVHVAEASTGAVAEQMERGGTLYKTHCAACHQAEGQGLPGAFPPLAKSDYLLADRKRAIETIILGRTGPIKVNGQDYNAVMPPMGYLADEEIADILTYTLNAWGNDGGPVTREQVAQVRSGAGVTDRAEGERHVGAPEGEMRYQGAPSAIAPEDTRQVMTREGPVLSDEEYATATRLYFERCAGCHGVLRKGATGKPLTPDITREKGTEYLKALITFGSPGGMPNFGSSGEIAEEQIDILARFLQQEPPEPPEFGMEEMKATWDVLVPPDKRPTKPQHDRNIDNFFAVTLRDSGQVAMIDGDTKEIVSIVETGYAVHISRPSASGRYVYTIGRDALVNMIDMY